MSEEEEPAEAQLLRFLQEIAVRGGPPLVMSGQMIATAQALLPKIKQQAIVEATKFAEENIRKDERRQVWERILDMSNDPPAANLIPVIKYLQRRFGMEYPNNVVRADREINRLRLALLEIAGMDSTLPENYMVDNMRAIAQEALDRKEST